MTSTLYLRAVLARLSKAIPPRFGRSAAFRDLARNDSGAAAMVIAISLTVLIGMVGLGVEVGAWYATKRHNQTAADSAALGAAYSIADSGNNSQVQATAEANAALNDVVDSSLVDITAVSPPSSGAYATNNMAVEVTVVERPQLLFSSLFGNSVSLTVMATALTIDPGPTCVLSLSKTATIGIQLNGSANLNLNGCGMYSNADDTPTSMTTSGGAQLQVVSDFFAMAGGYQANGSAVPVLDIPIITEASQMQDPFAGQIPPLPTLANLVPYANPTFGVNDTWLGEVGGANAPHFTNGLTFGSQADITIPPSVHEIYVTGQLKINAGAKVNCICTFVLTDSSSYVTINGNADLQITAPSHNNLSPLDPRYGGIAFYNAGGPGLSTQTSSFSGTGNTDIKGAIYMPNQRVEYRGTSTAGISCMRLIADTIVFIGNTASQLLPGGTNCPALPSTVDMDAPPVVRLVL